MNTTPTMLITRTGAAAGLAVSGSIHAELYVHGYRDIPTIGAMFLLQGAGSFAVALLLAIGGPPVMLRLGAAALAAGALGGFVLSRTVGVFGFTQPGLQPAPQSVISVLAEAATLILLVIPLLTHHAQRARAGRAAAAVTR